jgi:hypothetical protein
MDLLLAPDNVLVEKTPYIGSERWDGKSPFLSYAHKLDRSNLVPDILRHDQQFESLGLRYETYLEGYDGIDTKELQGLYQRWLFFGLLCEFLGLNPNEAGERIVSESVADKEIDALYNTLTVSEVKGGPKYIKVDMKAFRSWGGRMWWRFLFAKDRIRRFIHLRQCLRWTWGMLNSDHCRNGFDDPIRFSIAALGEALSSAMIAAIHGSKYSDRIPTIPAAWSRDFLRRDSPTEARMIANGWCASEIEKIRQQYSSLNAVHYMSWLVKPKRIDNHKNCTIHGCRAFKISSEYRPSHSLECNSQCKLSGLDSESGVDMKEVVRILKETPTFPVLRVEYDNVEEHDFQIHVEEQTDGVPYVAISHVCVLLLRVLGS